MATPDWTTVPDTSLEPGDPIRSIDIIAINNHVAAMAGGALGAPQITIMAIEGLTAGDIIRSRIDAGSINYSTDPITHHAFSFAQIGVVRVYAEHAQFGGASSGLGFVRIRNGVATTEASWSTTSFAAVPRSADISVLPGDEIKIQHNAAGGIDPSAGSVVGNARFMTAGENLWPGASVRLENDYTVE